MKSAAAKTRAVRAARVTSLTLLRAALGVILIAHGLQKLSDTRAAAQSFAEMGVPVPELMIWLAIAGEFLGGMGLLIGLLTRLSALGALLVMSGAIFFVHLGNGLLSANGGFEFPMLIGFVLLHFMLRGPGPISIDAAIDKQRGRRVERPEDRAQPKTPAAAPAARPRGAGGRAFDPPVGVSRNAH